MNPSTFPTNSALPPTSASMPTPAPAAASPTNAPAAIPKREARADAIKDHSSDVPRQAGQRWKHLLNLKEQLQRHSVAVVVSGVAVILAIGGGITIGVLATQHRKRLSYRVKKGLRQAESQLSALLP